MSLCSFRGRPMAIIASWRQRRDAAASAGRTEQCWCPIRHSQRVRAQHAEYRHFVDYGDAEGYRRRLIALRTLRD